MPEVVSKPVMKVAVLLPLPGLYDYTSDDFSPPPVGCRVLVPFRRRQIIGIVMEHAPQASVAAESLKAVIQCLDPEPIFTPELLRLCRWAADYYCAPIGEVMRVATSPRLRKPSAPPADAELGFALTELGQAQDPKMLQRAPKQAELLSRLSIKAVSAKDLNLVLSNWRPIMRALEKKGWVKRVPVLAAQLNVSSGWALNPQQRATQDAILQQGFNGFCCHLLDGVTGSGKTEIYLNLIERVLRANHQVLLLVPEIGLTPQLTRRFHKRFGVRPIIAHSGRTQNQRYQDWQAVRDGSARMVIGTRSAVWLPFADLGLIIVDEEHDASFKQQEGFRYHGRDVAIQRAYQAGIPIVLGSATPALESLENARNGRYQRHRLTERIGTSRLPQWQVIDMRNLPLRHGLTRPALELISAALQRNEQVIVFLNRRGYAPVLLCHSCGWHAQCQHCDAHTTWHRQMRRLRCHHCGYEQAVPSLCPQCQADALYGAGEGTEQLEVFLHREFAQVPVIRFDRDQTRTKEAFSRLSEKVKTTQASILVGTQMLAKGHHFPQVTLVVVVDIDQAWYSADFRAAERMGQLLVQVAGRAGRGERAGRVCVQTHHPEHPLLNRLTEAGYLGFAELLLHERQSTGLPPFGYFALLRASALKRQVVERFMRDAERCCPRLEHLQVLPAVPASMPRKAGRYRMQIGILAQKRPALRKLLLQWQQRLDSQRSATQVKWAFDVDAQEL